MRDASSCGARAVRACALLAAASGWLSSCSVPSYQAGADPLGVHQPAREELLAELALPHAHRDLRTQSTTPGAAAPSSAPTAPAGAAGRAVDAGVRPAAAPRERGALALEEVLECVVTRYPPYLSALLERDLATGRVQQALGAFDTVISGKLGRNFTGYYDATFGQALVEQPLPSGGSVYGGYRISRGLLPDYYGARTQRGGELAVGARLPLLRGLEIDARRLKLRQEEIDRALADPKIAAARIDFVYAAAIAYYEWIAAGQRLRITRELLALATDRVEGIQRGVERGFLAGIDVTDNERAIVQRRVFVVRAERALERAALTLSLFLRDANDDPVVPPEERLPKEFPTALEPDRSRFRAEAEAALRRRPELSEVRLLYDRAKTEEGFAENERLLDLGLVVDASKNLDQSPYFDRNEFELFLGLDVKLPVQRRDALGRLQQARTRMERLRIEGEFLRDRVLYEIADALSALETSFAQIEETERSVALALRMVQAERRAFELGRSDLLRINVREQDLANAEVLRLDALLDYWKAMANYRAAIGVDGEAELNGGAPAVAG